MSMATFSSQRFLTLEDLKIAFNVFCAVYGVGTLGMPGNFSRAGPFVAVLAMMLMAFANIYASVAISRVLLLAPTSVRTYGDLGTWVAGKWGHWLAVVAQMGSCLLIPCVFLVLGGSLLDGLFPNAFTPTVWIVFMALMCLPVCLIPTLKEGAGAAFAGCAGTLLADIISVSVVLHGMRGHPAVPRPHLTLSQVAGVFGNLSLAYGAGVVIPSLQRQHSDPRRMPRVICCTLTFISCLFLVLASTAYSAVGCQLKENLLFTIYPNATTKRTTLGFQPHWGAVVLAYLFMQLHITIAFSVLLHPVFYLSERLVLGMHKMKEQGTGRTSDCEYVDIETPSKDSTVSPGSAECHSETSFDAQGRTVQHDETEQEAAEYRGANTFKYVLLRLAIITLLVLLSVVLEDHFTNLADFAGASCISLNSIILPILFRMIKCWPTIPLYEKVLALSVVVICTLLAGYGTYTSGKTLFARSDASVLFPFCESEFENQVYYKATAVNG